MQNVRNVRSHVGQFRGLSVFFSSVSDHLALRKKNTLLVLLAWQVSVRFPGATYVFIQQMLTEACYMLRAIRWGFCGDRQTKDPPLMEVNILLEEERQQT